MLELKNVSKIYKTKTQQVKALDNINLYFEDKGLVFITGKSGSGKTTLLNVIGALDNFSSGEIIIKNKSTKDFSRADYDSYRNTFIGFVFQEYNLLENMTIEKNIALATELQGQKFDEQSVNKILEKVDLFEVAKRKPSELSGGQRQRVAIARALVKNPSIIMADEPTGALDTTNGQQIMSILKSLSKEKLVIVVSHDLELANNFADRIINLEDGHIESDITLKANKSRKNILETPEQLSIRKGAKLKEAELEKVKNAVANGKEIVVTDKINVTKSKTQHKARKKYEETNFIKTHLGFVDTLKLGVNALRSKKVRLTFTIILCAIAFAIFGIFDSLAIFDEGRLAVNSLKSSKPPSVIMTTNVKENNGNSYEISVNQELLDDLQTFTKYQIKGVYDSYYMGKNVPTQLSNNNPAKISKYYYYRNIQGSIEFDENDLKNYKYSMIYGELPKTFDEIAIPEYYAYCLVNWGYTYTNEEGKPVTIENIEDLVNKTSPLKLTFGTTREKKDYKIVGIVNVGKINSKFNKLKENFETSTNLEQNEFLNYIINSLNLFVFTKPGFADYAFEQKNLLQPYVNSAYTFQFADKNNDEIKTSRTSFYNYEDLLQNDNKQIYFLEPDKTALEENEILLDVSNFASLNEDLISKLLAEAENMPQYASEIENINIAIEQLSSKASSEEKIASLKSVISKLQEIQNAKLENTNSQSIFEKTLIVQKFDTSKYKPGTQDLVEVKVSKNTFKIAGYYTGIDVNALNSFVLTEQSIKNLGINTFQGKYSTLIATNTGKGNINKLSSLLLKDSGVCYSCKLNSLAIIRANSDFFRNLSLLFLIAALIFAIFSIAMFSNFISTSIKNKYAEIGILRALGARGGDILKMFVVESVVLALINALIATIITGVGCIFVNMFLSSYLNLYISLAAFGIRQILIIFALSILVAIVSAIIPIWSISKQKPVETIRKAF